MNNTDSGNQPTKKASVSQQLPYIYSGNKALGMSFWKNNIILSIAKQGDNNGKQVFDYDNGEKVILDFQDMILIYNICVNLMSAYVAKQKKISSDISSITYGTMPIVNKFENKTYGLITIGYYTDNNTRADVFYLKLEYQEKTGAQKTGMYTFYTNLKPITYFNSSDAEVFSSVPKLLGFSEFVRTIKSILEFGKLMFSNTQKTAELMFAGKKAEGGGNNYSGGKKYNNYNNNNKYNNQSSGQSSGGTPASGYGDDDDIPF